MTSVRALVATFALASIILAAGAHDAGAQSESAAPRMQVPIANLPGQTFTSAIVTFPPGAKAAPHRHGDAFVYAYVLSGSVRSQLDDEPAKVYQAGEDWYERPGARHKLTENTSSAKEARLLVVFIAPAGTPLKIPD